MWVTSFNPHDDESYMFTELQSTKILMMIQLNRVCCCQRQGLWAIIHLQNVCFYNVPDAPSHNGLRWRLHFLFTTQFLAEALNYTEVGCRGTHCSSEHIHNGDMWHIDRYLWNALPRMYHVYKDGMCLYMYTMRQLGLIQCNHCFK